MSTDSVEYAEIARSHGAEVPFLRPAEYATDTATDLQVFEHALEWLSTHDGWCPDICVHLRPTYPYREPATIDRAVEFLNAHSDVHSVRSVVLAPDTPYKMWTRNEEGMLAPLLKDGPSEAWNLPRQLLPPVYYQNAAIDVVWSRVILQQRSMTGTRIYGLLMSDLLDIDTETQWQAAERELLGKSVSFDIDSD